MKIRHIDIARIRSVCKHESGHYIVGRELSFNTHGIKVNFSYPNGHSGEAALEPWTPNVTSIEQLKDYLERRLKVLYAGAISESMDRDGKFDNDRAINEWRAGGSVNDYAKIRELVQTLRNIDFPSTDDTSKIQGELDQIDNKIIQLT